MKLVQVLLTGAISLPLWSQTAFEVASIRLHQGVPDRVAVVNLSGRRATLEAFTMFQLVQEAYHLRASQISAEPVARRQELEVFDTSYDVIAQAPEGTALTRDEMRRMLQTLLTDRFNLGIHRETKQTPVYVLASPNGGLRIKESTASGDCSVRRQIGNNGRLYIETFSNCPMEALVRDLENIQHDRPVLDMTGLAGRYDFQFLVTPNFGNASQLEPSEVSLFTALRELGLHLEPQKTAVETIFIDHLEKPTGN